MESVQEIEQAVSKLGEQELSRFRAWFEEFDAGIWDRQIERDAASGKLDAVAAKARGEQADGKSAEL